jgi:hypothetical protein
MIWMMGSFHLGAIAKMMPMMIFDEPVAECRNKFSLCPKRPEGIGCLGFPLRSVVRAMGRGI